MPINAGFCACTGPIGSDPYCPCEMASRGLAPSVMWTDEEKAALHSALATMFGWADEDNQNILLSSVKRV